MLNTNFSIKEALLDEIMVHLNVFGTCMEDWILCKFQCPLIIIVKNGGGQGRALRMSESLQEREWEKREEEIHIEVRGDRRLLEC